MFGYHGAWLPGSVWTTYLYQRHTSTVGWTPIALTKRTINSQSAQITVRVHLITLLMGHVQDVKPCQILQNTVTLFNMQCTFTVGLFHLRPAIFSLKQVKSKLLTAPNTGKENPLCNFALVLMMF